MAHEKTIKIYRALAAGNTPPGPLPAGELALDHLSVPPRLYSLGPGGTNINLLQAAAGGALVIVADSPPVATQEGDLWLDSISGGMFIWYTDHSAGQWIALPAGARGIQGIQGVVGPIGETGTAATVTVGTTTTGAAGSNAAVTEAGGSTAQNRILDFSIPQGIQGTIGNTGPPNSLAIGTVVGGASAGATITGAAPSQTLNLTLPTGPTGPANTLAIGTVVDGASADATVTGSAPNQTLNLVLPIGATGPQGEQGIQGDPGSLGVGVVSGTDAAAGDVGEYMESVQGTNVAMAANASVNITNLALTAGDWEVWGGFAFVNTAAMTNTVGGTVRSGLNNASATLPANYYLDTLTGGTASQANIIAATLTTLVPPRRRFNSASAQTIYLVSNAVGAGNGQGFLAARRIR